MGYKALDVRISTDVMAIKTTSKFSGRTLVITGSASNGPVIALRISARADISKLEFLRILRLHCCGQSTHQTIVQEIRLRCTGEPLFVIAVIHTITATVVRGRDDVFFFFYPP